VPKLSIEQALMLIDRLAKHAIPARVEASSEGHAPLVVGVLVHPDHLPPDAPRIPLP